MLHQGPVVAPHCEVCLPGPRCIVPELPKWGFLELGYIGVIWGLYRDNGKENGNYYNRVYSRVHIGMWVLEGSEFSGIPFQVSFLEGFLYLGFYTGVPRFCETTMYRESATVTYCT